MPSLSAQITVLIAGMKVRKPVSLSLADPRLNTVLRVRVGGPKAAKRPRTERATHLSTLNTLRFEGRSINDL
jgi:hypothetical protein